MSYLEYRVQTIPTGPAKVLHLNWPLVLLLITVAALGLLMLYSVAGGSMDPWAGRQLRIVVMGLCVMFAVAMVPIWFWRNVSALAYLGTLGLLLLVEFVGDTGGGAQRWIDLRVIRLQPSELMKITLVMMLAAYYDWLDVGNRSRPIWVLVPVILILIPTYLVLRQPDLGTSILLVTGGAFVMFAAGVHWLYFATVATLAGAFVTAVLRIPGLISAYQYKRIDTFLNPAKDPLGDGYQITQSKIALGSGGWTGRGYMQGTQSRLNFLPEKHTDFIFTTLAEEFGFLGAASLLVLYGLIILFCIASALSNTDRFASLLTIGVAGAFFLYFAVNMSMVMGLAPVVGVPLPLVSYGGSAMLVLLGAFGLVQSAHVHRPRGRS